MHIYIKEAVGETQASWIRTRWLETQAQLIKGGDISLVSKKRGSRLPGMGPSISIAPFCKTQSAYYKETLIGNAKREPPAGHSA